MNILVVDDNSAFRHYLRKILTKADYQIFTAENGMKAIDILSAEKIDAVITDWMMPQMDGIELVNTIRKMSSTPPAIIVVTALALKEAFDKAMKAGADDYLSKPVTKESVLQSLETCLLRRQQELAKKEYISDNNQKPLPDFYGIGIAASTGGPMTLVELLDTLQPTKKAAYFIVLHGPKWMLQSFVERNQQKCKLPLFLGMDKQKIEAGNIYLAPGEIHMVLNHEKMEISLIDTPSENFVKPSADPLFRSIASIFRSKSIGIILTGMGQDGTIGSGYIRASGGIIIAQSPDTAVISSMPKSVIDLRIAEKIAKISEIRTIIDAIVN